VWSDLLEQLHDGAGTSELDLANGNGGGGVELAGLAFERVKGVETEELVHDCTGLGVKLLIRLWCVQSFVEVLDDHVL